MATTKRKAPAKRGSTGRKASTDKELQKLGRDVAKAANALQKSGPSAARVIPIPRCLSQDVHWCIPTQDVAGKRVWIEIRSAKKPRP